MRLLPWGVMISVGRWSGMGGWFGEVYTEYMAVMRLAHVYKQTKKDEPAIGRWRFRIKAFRD